MSRPSLILDSPRWSTVRRLSSTVALPAWNSIGEAKFQALPEACHVILNLFLRSKTESPIGKLPGNLAGSLPTSGESIGFLDRLISKERIIASKHLGLAAIPARACRAHFSACKCRSSTGMDVLRKSRQRLTAVSDGQRQRSSS